VKVNELVLGGLSKIPFSLIISVSMSLRTSSSAWWAGLIQWNPLRIFRHRRMMGWLFVGGLLLNVMTWGLLLWTIPFGTSSIVLHYNIFAGIDRVGTWWELSLLPGTGTAILFLHTALVITWFEYERLVRWFLMGTAVGYQALLLLYAVFLILQNR
jgi:hypothetical protein